jgi:hypothetical protein
MHLFVEIMVGGGSYGSVEDLWTLKPAKIHLHGFQKHNLPR